jgi:hypothetical protein
MASSYSGFYVNAESTAGVIEHVGAGVSVAIYDTVALADAAESPLTTDVNGYIAAGSLAAVDVGTKVIFRVEDYNGMAASSQQITT